MAQKEKITSNSLISSKKLGKKIAMLTAYDSAIAKILDGSNIDIILVGDSLGNVMLGYKNTLPVTLIEMIIHTQAVSRAVNRAMVVSDMPFGTFQKNDEEAVSNAVDLIKSGANAVKVEGVNYKSAIKKIIKAGIPVMGHLGFTPQSVNILGYKVQGKDHKSKLKIIKDAKALEKTGCFALILEMVPEDLAAKIAKSLKIPVIGIGAGSKCDGQVLVSYDMLGIYKNAPSFVKKYADIGKTITQAVEKYINDVKK
ncbi:3-methyl-2-oxobutanoate hydroxymethyltransferase [Candidatus Saganbacteria bacterium]|nr:3-methyl-2-oxobutanoate hydroxymethyltransferase [Candidatus Saganbacteria bacterium]